MLNRPLPLLLAAAMLNSISFASSAADYVPTCLMVPTPPRFLQKPKYPKAALREGRSGVVDLRAVVSSEGKTQRLEVVKGDPDFSQSALKAVTHWKFRPSYQAGNPTEATFLVHIRFDAKLREASSDMEIESPRLTPPEHLFELEEGVHRMPEPGLVPPKAIYFPEPQFSEKARQEKEQGTVTLFVVVGADGLPKTIKLLCSSNPENNDQAINALRTWRFTPGSQNGAPVAVAIYVEVSFHLYNDPR